MNSETITKTGKFFTQMSARAARASSLWALLGSLLILWGCDGQRTAPKTSDQVPKNPTTIAKNSEPVPWPPTRLVEAGWHSSWSPDGTQLIYTTPTRDAIEILDLRTLKRTALTRLGKDPAWSPDGRYVALVREPTYDAYQDETVWLCALDSPQPRRVVSGGCPSWSSDGKTLYVHDR
jgi:WD40 repeat protein